MTRNPVGKLLLFGATGDLSQRMLLPSLFNLHSDGLLPEGLTITGTARSDHDDASFREFAAKALDTFLPDDRKDADKIASFLERVQYQSLDASSTDGFPALAEKVGDVSNGLAIYLSTAPSLFESTIKGLESVGLAGETVRIGLEKPLGYDLASSKEINDAVDAAAERNGHVSVLPTSDIDRSGCADADERWTDFAGGEPTNAAPFHPTALGQEAMAAAIAAAL